MYGFGEARREVVAAYDEVGAEEYGGGDNLYLYLFPEEMSGVAYAPAECGFVGDEAADEEEEGHPEEDEE